MPLEPSPEYGWLLAMGDARIAALEEPSTACWEGITLNAIAVYSA
jgi:hypothetical protein